MTAVVTTAVNAMYGKDSQDRVSQEPAGVFAVPTIQLRCICLLTGWLDAAFALVFSGLAECGVMVNKFSCLTEYDASQGGQAVTSANAHGRDHPLAGMDNFASDSAHASTSEVVSSDVDPPRPVKQPMVWVDLEMTG